MKRISQIIILFAILVSSMMGRGTVLAATKPQGTGITFSSLGLDTDIVLYGPYDAGALRFDLPATWELNSGAELELIISAYFAGGSDNTSADGDYIGAALGVYFNDKLQQSVSLRSGTNVAYRIPINTGDLPSPYSDGGYKISFYLDASVDCDSNFHQTTVSIDATSIVNLPYSEVPLPLNLHRIPFPIYQERSVNNDTVLVITPASPTADEVRAALLVMGTFGKMTNGHLPVRMVTSDELTDDARVGSHLIFVGKPSGLPVLTGVPLQATIGAGGYMTNSITDTDGYIEMAISPWNEEKAVLIVGGNTDQAVVKAAQALSTGNLQTGDNLAYSIVADVNPTSITGILSTDSNLLPPPDYSLADLGYGAETVSDIGTNWFSFNFVIPVGQIPSETPSLNLLFSHSALIDVNRSDVSVYFNDTLAGSVKLSEDDSNLVSAQIKLPVSGMQSGQNDISISATLIPRDDCSITTFSGMWMTIYPESTLHMPLIRSLETTTSFLDLSVYPYPFINDPELSSTAFVLPSNDRVAWSIAGDIAYDLGASSTGSILDMGAFYDGALPEEVFDRDLILIGQPANLKIISDLRESLPAYFDEGSNIAVLNSQQVIYRISSEKSLGYLETFSSPNNAGRTILAILGTNQEGLKASSSVLLAPRSREVLNGNFATIDGDKPFVVDTRTGSGMGRIVTGIGESNVDVDSGVDLSNIGDAPLPTYTGNQYILYGLIGIVVVMAMVIVVVLVLRKRRA